MCSPHAAIPRPQIILLRREHWRCSSPTVMMMFYVLNYINWEIYVYIIELEFYFFFEKDFIFNILEKMDENMKALANNYDGPTGNYDGHT